MSSFWSMVHTIKWIAGVILVLWFLAAIADATEKPTPNPCVTYPNGDIDCPELPDHEWQVP